MRVNVILLDYERHDYTKQVIDQNFNNAGYPFDHITVNKKGISAAFNHGLSHSLNYDAVVFMANDILMPENWLRKMVEAAEAIPNTGSAGIHCVEGIEPPQTINGVTVHITATAFGNTLTPISVIEKIGGFNTDFDPYGMQDADFGYRARRAGFINYYLHSMTANHIGHDVGNGSDYRKMKDEGLSLAGDKWGKWTEHYERTGNYIIDMPEWPDEK